MAKTENSNPTASAIQALALNELLGIAILPRHRF